MVWVSNQSLAWIQASIKAKSNNAFRLSWFEYDQMFSFQLRFCLKYSLTENWVFIRFILHTEISFILLNLSVQLARFCNSVPIDTFSCHYLMRRNLLHFAKTEFSNCLRLVNLTRKHTIQNGGHFRISFSTGKLFPFVRLCNHRDSHNLNTRMF